MPSVANKNFPYHVRTTQIGIMELTGRHGTSTMEQFGHHMYEPTATIREQTVIIPLTRRTEEYFETMQHQQERRNVEELQNDDLMENEKNKTIENVLRWSLARNVPILNLSTASDNSQSDNTNALSRNASFREIQTPKNCSEHNEEHIKDVPIELFTVSKMVITTSNVDKCIVVPRE
ncbi:unnamed protein product [Diabrotica balteata]|uniref:Uncharacterized protein n=1 Tax=Diabrotica balteata TaxID=107213 RepID=A0A9N9T577_DIABA|nr:unnamed protein product [Diabrotica balteata]